MKITVSINVVILMMAIGISTLVGGFTGSAFAQGDNQTNVGQGKNNTDSENRSGSKRHLRWRWESISQFEFKNRVGIM